MGSGGFSRPGPPSPSPGARCAGGSMLDGPEDPGGLDAPELAWYLTSRARRVLMAGYRD